MWFFSNKTAGYTLESYLEKQVFNTTRQRQNKISLPWWRKLHY